MSESKAISLTPGIALKNIETYNAQKQHDRVGNFADLKVQDGMIAVDKTTNKAARFAATFFSFGLCQGYRDENKERSLQVQKALQLSVKILLEASDEDLEQIAAERNISKKDLLSLRETSLKTFQATVFQTRGFFWPIAAFYYFVLGVQNQLLERVKIVFAYKAKNQVAALQNAVHSVTGSPAPRMDKTPEAPMLLTFSSKCVVVEIDSKEEDIEIKVDGPKQEESDEEVFGSHATLSPSVHSKAESTLGKPLTGTQKKYVEFATQAAINKEEHDAQACGFQTVSAYSEARKELNALQDRAVEQETALFIQKWKETDLALVDAAAEAGYISHKEAKQAIEEYYAFLAQNKKEAAKMRREAQAAMSQLSEEVTHEMVLDLAGSFGTGQMPEILKFIFNAPEDVLLAADSDQKTLAKLSFAFIAYKINKKIQERYKDQLSGPTRALINYQVIMLALKTFGVSGQTHEMMQNMMSGMQDPTFTQKTFADLQFEQAFEGYKMVINDEQKLHLRLMQRLATGESLTVKDYFEEIAQILQAKGKPSSVMTMTTMGAQNGPIGQLPDLDINSLGIQMKTLDPETQELANAFAKSFMWDSLKFMFQLPGLMMNLEENDPPPNLLTGSPGTRGLGSQPNAYRLILY